MCCMLIAKQRSLMVGLCIASLLLLSYVYNPFGETLFKNVSDTYGDYQMKRPVPKQVPAESKFLIDLPGCQIPNVDPFDETVRHLYQKQEPMQCKIKLPDLTFSDGNWLKINRTALKPYGIQFPHCYYENIIYVENGDQEISYVNKTQFMEDVEIPYEMIRVSCFNHSDELYVNYHVFIQVKQTVEIQSKRKTKEFVKKFKPKENLSILLLSLDSVSRLNSMRHFTQTRDFLLNTLGAIEMKGYNKIGDNTIPNLMAILTGMHLHSLKNKVNGSAIFYDKIPELFIWNDYSERGYQTLFSEINGIMPKANATRMVFTKIPANYYLTPLDLAMLLDSSINVKNRFCVRSKPLVKVHLDYLYEYLKKFKNKSTFSFSHHSRITHNRLNWAGLIDTILLEFFQKLSHSDILTNLVVVFYSDHGMRYGDIRKTYIGMLEDRLPFMYLIFPHWFHKKYPVLSRNLRINSERLTTPFDIHALLKDMVNFTGKADYNATRSEIGLSLLTEIPVTRTCRDAHVSYSYCSCLSWKYLNTNDSQTKLAGEVVVSSINQKLAAHEDMCASLSLDHISKAWINSRPSWNEMIIPAFRTQQYQVQVKTKPFGASFEAIVEHNKTSGYKVLGDINRINMYGNQSICAPEYLQKYCYCL